MNTSTCLVLRLFALSLLLSCVTSDAASFYVDVVSGNDTKNGTSPSTAWKTIAKVNKVRFSAGDLVRFQGGQTFPGNLSFTSSGTATNPITINSYGTGTATIYAATGHGMNLSNASYVIITNLKVTGPGWNTVKDGSRGLYIQGTTHHCTVDHVTASGFHKAGVELLDRTRDNRLTFVTAEQNGFTGITIQGANQYASDCKADNNHGDLTVTNNWSGSGIFVASASYVTVEYSEASYNGGSQPWTGNGPVGIWCWNANHITFQHCISHHNRRGQGNTDGGGFDFDGGTTDSLIQYCYSYNNAGAGYLCYNFAYQSIPHRNNTVRYSISENDAMGGVYIGTGGLPVENLNVYNNVFFNTDGGNVLRNGGGAMTNVSLRNNLFISSGNLNISSGGFTLQGNCYYSSSNSYSFDGWGNNFAGWVSGTGQEKLNGQMVGLNVDPALFDVGNGTKLVDPRQLSTLRSYAALSGGSPVINAGLNLQALFGIAPGSFDFIGAPIPNGAFDMGAYEYAPVSNQPPGINTQPANVTVMEGQTATFTVAAYGSSPLSYQWKKNGSNISGAVTASYTTPPTSAADNGSLFSVSVSNPYGNVTSNSATLNVGVVPSNWVSQDIGAVGVTGSTTYANGVFTVNASGADIFGTADEFRYVNQAVSGDCDIKVRVASLQYADGWAKAGVMIRETLNADSKHAMMVVTPGNGASFQYRANTAGSSDHNTPGDGVSAPCWVRLTRIGNLFTGYKSSDGSTWTQVSSTTIAMGTNVYVGAAVTSHNDSVLCTATLENLTVSTSGLPSPLVSQDIGAVGAPGSAAHANGTYTVKGSGADIWDMVDEFHYVSQAASGDCEIKVRVVNQQNTDGWAKAGVMIRETLNANSAHAMMVLTPGNGTSFQNRSNSGGSSSHTTPGDGSVAPGWVKIVRSGNTLSGYKSSDGVNWTTGGSTTLTMGADVYIGLAVSSHNDGVLSTVTFDNLTIVP